jgi:hypothetical protein
MRELLLNKRWTIYEKIGSGGFGQVYAAENEEGLRAAIKLVPKAPGADRELLFTNLKGIVGIIPIIDSGEHENSWVLVMPRAEESLRQHMTNAGGKLSVQDAVPVLTDIASTLAELDGKAVHRDLKPENVLLLDGHWRLSDFGISRYAEATTAIDTQKYALSPPYAAPERWRAERATGAADVYALGIMAFEMLSGRRPFPGPTAEDYREQHLHEEPPVLDAGTSALRGLVMEALFKAPGARPSPENLLARFRRSRQQGAGGLAKLSEAYLHEVAARSERERKSAVAGSVAERRTELLGDAATLLDGLYEEVTEAILNSAPSARQGTAGKPNGITFSLGPAFLELVPLDRTSLNPWGQWEAPAFDVIAHAGIVLRVPRDGYDYEGRSHSLWYCDALKAGRYEWIEIAFMLTPFSGRTTYLRPFMANPGIEAAKALWVGLSEFQLAWPMEPLNTEAFTDRWTGWLADAVQGRLHSPSTMPERPIPENWRKR